MCVDAGCGVLLVGLLLGMTHALEMDHLAAVASLASRSPSAARALRLGAAWGIGHTITLFLVGSAVLGFGTSVPQALSQWLELGVAVMLVMLGCDVLRRLIRYRVHAHAHSHAGGATHLHAHSHAHQSGHHHPHAEPLGMRALLVGLMHGLAGSAALVLLVLASVENIATGLLYIVLFGFGSVLGMALLSVAVSLPLRHSARFLVRFRVVLEGTVGIITAGLGLVMLATNLTGLTAQ